MLVKCENPRTTPWWDRRPAAKDPLPIQNDTSPHQTALYQTVPKELFL